jgi:hypothetical protein
MSLEDLVIVIGEFLKTKGVDIILVGGACVTIYSKNAYISGDLDLITYHDGKKVKQYLAELGFEFTASKYFVHKNTDYIVEFVNPPISIGNEPVHEFHNHKTSLGEIKLLTATDTVKDRLSAYYHWNDEQSLEQALLVVKEVDVDFENIRLWSEREAMTHKFQIFMNHLTHKHSNSSTF